MKNKTGGVVQPAVVIGAQVNGLGVVRSLAEGGLPIVVLGKSRRHAAMWSRWSKSRVVDPLYGQPLVDALLQLHREIGARPVLILTDELAVDTVSEYRTRLSPHFQFRLPSPAMVRTLSNKASVQRFAEAHALPTPRTMIVERESDLSAIADLGMPVIVKPADKLPVHLGRVERAMLAATMNEAAATCGRLLNVAGTLVVQEWIDGPDSNIYFSLFHCGRSPMSRTIFFGRKLAARPPRVGSTALCIAAPETANLLRPITDKFLDVSEYEGLGSIEFKWDPRAHRFVIIEPTVGRTDWQEEIATLNGLNLPLIAYRYELGLPAPDARPGKGAAWRESFLRNRRRAGSGVRTYDGYWRVDDPLPAFAFGIDVALRRTGRLLPAMFELGKPLFQRQRTA